MMFEVQVKTTIMIDRSILRAMGHVVKINIRTRFELTSHVKEPH
jgi:hypothetical protein